MNRLSVKLTLLFVVIALVAVGVIGFWVNNAVQNEFSTYYQQVPHGGGRGGSGMMMGALEQAFLGSFKDSLWLAAIVAILIAVVLGLVFSKVITSPLKQLTLSAKKIAGGDFSQRVNKKK
jgi:methyl-accepting chemotaxis protein